VLWSSTLAEVLRVSAKAGAVTDVEAINGDVFLTTHRDGAVQLLDSRSGNTSRLATLPASVTSASHSGAATYLISECGQLGYFDIRMPETPVQLTVTFTQPIDSLACCVKSEGNALAVGYQDGGLQVFSLPDFRQLMKAKPHIDIVSGLSWQAGLLYSVSYSGVLQQLSLG
jgi:WD40 repeat protein